MVIPPFAPPSETEWQQKGCGSRSAIQAPPFVRPVAPPCLPDVSPFEQGFTEKATSSAKTRRAACPLKKEPIPKILKTKNKSKPFFMYYASNFPHTPLYASPDFEGKSKRGLYGDVVEELDWSVGQILKTLKEQKLDENTAVIFTSDNGPWLIMEERGGSAGLLFEGKNSA